MNYRAWNHRCWLISYMTNKQVLYEMKKSRSWAALHVSDNCCFHYRSLPSIILPRLLQKIVEDQNYAEETASYGQNADIVQVVKDKIDWNETLIKRYVGRVEISKGHAGLAHTLFLSKNLTHFPISIQGYQFQ
ncbi:protein prenyltransferase alpha subunit repeat-containing protein 1-A-like [Trifolium pratense]|uniref:protein prenyltransferase alpha subunit repeat-containing protein 1-A-like n=1 Tax=Trifolium pratense TaxID=57577 RepID=UPI001E697BA6|nr:protein prenyltransferase alpha subunit repeat-containing protein 1-A-like [Trifolium pratense]